MSYGYVGAGEAGEKHLSIPRGQWIAGHAIGILHLEVWYPLLPGNVVNASTYPFPVRYKALQGATQERIHAGDPDLVEAIIAAGRALEGEGVRAIVGACGYLGNYQPQAAGALDVPVFLSSLLQVPMILQGLKPGQRVGILCADQASITPQLLAANGIGPEAPIAVLGLGDQPQFSQILHSRGGFEVEALEREVVQGAQRLVAEQGDIGALLLECSDMPPFAHAVQQAVHMPVFDFISMIHWVYRAVVQRPYEGIL